MAGLNIALAMARQKNDGIAAALFTRRRHGRICDNADRIGRAEMALDRVVNRLLAPLPSRPMRRAFAGVVMASVLSVATAAGAGAQTLTEPHPHSKWLPPSAAAPGSPSRRLKSCSIYGAGFVNVPGTDACVKIGGYVGADVTTGH